MPSRSRSTPKPPAITYRPTREMRERLSKYARERRWPLATAIDVILDQTLDPLAPIESPILPAPRPDGECKP